jgi:hypothetical protein
MREVVLKGIEALTLSAAYIFAFNPMLHRLKITTADACLDMGQEILDVTGRIKTSQ